MSKLEQAPHAILSAAWFYAIQSKLIEPGNSDDFIWITRSINGGYNGYDHRLEYLNRTVETLNLQGCLKRNKNGIYNFEESKAFNEKRAACAWGMWHDSGLRKSGIANKTPAEAIKGYKRYLELDDAAGKPVDVQGNPKDQGWYGIGKEKPVRYFAENRLKILGGS